MAASAVFQNAAKILVMRLERGMPAPLFQQPLAWPVPVIYLVMITMSLLSSGMGLTGGEAMEGLNHAGGPQEKTHCHIK